jgi:glutaredoxin
MRPIEVKLYKWAGAWGPFKIKIPCGECTLTKDILLDTIAHELNGIPVEVETKDWLSHWWEPILQGGWHAPIVLVEGRVVSQGVALNRGVIAEAIIKEAAKRTPVVGTVVFGKESCPHCKRAKEFLNQRKISYTYRDVVKEPRHLYEMITRVKPIIGEKTPVTVPQIWVEGDYVGGADDLEARYSEN